MNLRDILKQVKDDKLSKAQIESYVDELTHLYSDVCLALAEHKKKEALYFADHMTRFPEDSDAKIKRLFKVTPEGLRLIELDCYKQIIPKELASLKNRIYSLL